MLTCGFERGVNGNTVSTADAGDQDAFDSVSITGDASIVYDSSRAASGSLCARYTQKSSAPSTITTNWREPRAPTQTDTYGRFYVYMTAYVASGVGIGALILDSSATLSSRVTFASTGVILLLDNGGLQTSGSIPAVLNQWIRVEYRIICSATVGQIEAKLFNRPYSTVATETVTSPANRNTLASVSRAQFGLGGDSPVSYSAYLDGLVAGNTAYPGPVQVIQQPTLRTSAGVFAS